MEITKFRFETDNRTFEPTIVVEVRIPAGVIQDTVAILGEDVYSKMLGEQFYSHLKEAILNADKDAKNV
jgi:hypothetical protein